MKFKKLLVLSLVLAAAIFLRTNNAFAATRTWDGSAGDKKFSTDANWSGDTAPVDDDTIEFPASAGEALSTDSLDNDITGLSVAGINFTGDAGSTCNSSYKNYLIT